MFVQIVDNQESASQDIFVLGEKLVQDHTGVYLIPGRLITGLKTDDLPAGFSFGLLDQLPSGVGFYREDTVTLQRGHTNQTLHIQVTTKYVRIEWDGVYSLVSTMDTRRRLLEDTNDFQLEHFTINEHDCILTYSFNHVSTEEQDLEQTMEKICERVRWVEEKGNEQLLFGSVHPRLTMRTDE